MAAFHDHLLKLIVEYVRRGKVHTFVYKYRYMLPKYNSNLANKKVGNVPGFGGNWLS